MLFPIGENAIQLDLKDSRLALRVIRPKRTYANVLAFVVRPNVPA
jgi:hypothetical protein